LEIKDFNYDYLDTSISLVDFIIVVLLAEIDSFEKLRNILKKILLCGV